MRRYVCEPKTARTFLGSKFLLFFFEWLLDSSEIIRREIGCWTNVDTFARVFHFPLTDNFCPQLRFLTAHPPCRFAEVLPSCPSTLCKCVASNVPLRPFSSQKEDFLYFFFPHPPAGGDIKSHARIPASGFNLELTWHARPSFTNSP